MAAKYLVDTNVWSEATRLLPASSVINWIGTNYLELAVSCITVAEIQAGISKMDAGKRRDNQEIWFAKLLRNIPCFSWDKETALIWGKFVGEAMNQGLIFSYKDSMIAASALRHNLTVVTRNTKDFKRVPGIRVLNPFDVDNQN